MKASLLIMAILTVIYASAAVYALATSSSSNTVYSSDYGKHPTEYGIWRHYFADKLEAEPQKWNITEELGITLVQSKAMEYRYHIYIVDEEKALPWMNGTKPDPYAVKYENEFYRIYFLWVTSGLQGSPVTQLTLGGILVSLGWLLGGAFFIKARKAK